MKTSIQLVRAAAAATILWGASLGLAQAQTTLRMTWYSDGAEGEVMKDLLARFEAKNPDVKVVLDAVPFKAINETLPVQLAAGQGPDMARVTDLGGLARYALDLRPLVNDPAYWEANFGPFLPWMREAGNKTAIPGLMTQLTVTGPFVNKTLFEQAGVALPDAKARWEDWAKAAKTVAEKTKAPFPIALDRSGHRFYGVAVSMGSTMISADGKLAPVDEGFKRAATMIVDWHRSGVMSKELWGSVSGAAYRGANEEFKNAQVPFYLSGSWQIAQFDKTVGDAFDWVAVPTPCGPANCSGMPGGAGLIAIKATKYPKEVARVMDYLASDEVMSEFLARSLFVPGHLGVAKKGVAYVGASKQASAALKVFGDQVATLAPAAYAIQGDPNSRIVFNAAISRIGQAVSGEIGLDDAFARIQQDVAQQVAEREKTK